MTLLITLKSYAIPLRLKELIARAIHFGGERAKGPFMVLNCSAIPGELAESTLFGHSKGTFTGANTSRKGYFELSDGGTLFLDEIGDMPLELQPKLLRVIEYGSFVPVGSDREKHVDVRILAATNQNLREKIAEGAFRNDLYFRLEGFTVTVPPLRKRKEDIPLLTEHFLKMFTEEMRISKPTLSFEAKKALEEYHFPGNVRELKNTIESALIKSAGLVIKPEHLLNAVNIVSDGQTAPSPLTDEENILAYLKEHGSISNSECRNLLSVSRRRASYLLEKMCIAGLLTCKGSRRWTQYYLQSQ